MKFSEIVRLLLEKHPKGLTPQELRDLIKKDHPEHYGTESHQRNVAKGHYTDLDHALLAQIYVVRQNASDIYADTSQKPMLLILDPGTASGADIREDAIVAENLSKLEAGVGTLYVLGTNLYTKAGEEIIKIGITTGPVESRIDQLYNTSVPYRFRSLREYETEKYAELEQALHRMFDPFRINQSREYFTDKCLPFIDSLISTHESILAASKSADKEKPI